MWVGWGYYITCAAVVDVADENETNADEFDRSERGVFEEADDFIYIITKAVK